MIPLSPKIAGRGFNLDYVGAKVAQNYGRAWTRDEAREVHYFQARKNIVSCHCVSLNQLISISPQPRAAYPVASNTEEIHASNRPRTSSRLISMSISCRPP